MSGRAPVHTGGCQCGAVRYALYAEPTGVHFCHCRMCQKAVGGPFVSLAPVALADFAWTRGTPAVFQSSSAAIRHFCAACGTPLTFRYVAKEHIAVTTGSLDRPQDVPITLHWGVESRMPWLDAAHLDGLPQRVTAEDAPGGTLDLVSFQHPDHDTPPDWRPPTA